MSSPKIEVYRIDTFSGENNEYGVDRSESWVLSIDSLHDTIEDAKDCVRSKSRVFTDLPLFVADFNTQEEKDSAAEEFCFSDKYLKYQRFFVGKPSIANIKKRLKEEGVRVQINS